METITLTLPESQIIEWARQLSPQAKQAVLRAHIPELDELEALVDYGGQRMQQLCAERGTSSPLKQNCPHNRPVSA